MEVIQGKYVNGAYVTELNVSVQEWVDILSNKDVTTLNYKEALMAFYNAPNHTASCKELSEQYYDNAKDAQKYNAWITKFGQAVVKYLNRFKVVNEKGNEIFWAVIMSSGKTNENNLFEWTLRTEIIKAIENLGWAKTWIPFYMELADKLLLYKDRRQELLDIVAEIDDKRYVDIDPFSIFSMFNKRLKDENRKKRCVYFKQKFGLKSDIPVEFAGVPCAFNTRANFFDKEGDFEEIQNLWNLFDAVINKDEYIEKYFDIVCEQKGIKWNITMGLFWIRPYDFISLDSVNRPYLSKIGIKVFDAKQLNAENYFELNNSVKDMVDKGEIEEKDIPDISYRAWRENSKNEEIGKCWLVGYSFGGKNSQIERFLKEGIWEGRFDVEKDKKQISLAKKIVEGDVIILKSSFTKGTKHDVSCLRVKAVGVVTDEVEITEMEEYIEFKCNVDYVNFDEVDFDGYGSYRQTIHRVDSKHTEIVDYVNNILEDKLMIEKNSDQKYREYIKLLKGAHNLVLTGAPGTGKTYMAREIAKEMGAETEFVQFHPSYDYTDFVEGLRPVEKNDGQIGFERRDGIFKEFCKRAIRNLLDSSKEVDVLTKEKSWEDKLTQFVEDAINNETIYETVSGSKFTIKDVRNRTIVVYNEQNEKTTNIVVSMDEILTLLTEDVELNIIKDIKKYFNRKFATQADSYTFAIVREVRAMKQEFGKENVAKVERKDFVFIIDEINRGEASKIFGELFYAIDPGYRGVDNNRVKTQYQNLIPESDVFVDGFYVPENVYILATMNDIDRSVESMDFAMRRRFTWKEIVPNDTASMLDSLACAAEARKRMERLNEAIAKVDGLGKAYMIGPAYFLKLKDNNGDFKALWDMNLQPLLHEYLRGFRKAEEILKDLEKAYNDVNSEQEVVDGNNEN